LSIYCTSLKKWT